MSAQATLNIITVHTRQVEINDETEDSTKEHIIEQAAAIDIETYLSRKNKVLAKCVYKRLKDEGKATLGDLIRESEYEKNRDRKKRIELVMCNFPRQLKELAMQSTNESNLEDYEIKHIINFKTNMLTPITQITTKEIQQALKVCLGKVSSENFNEKLETTTFETENIVKFRKYCKNTNLRNIYFRLIHKDFFTQERMNRYGMCENNQCTRCMEVESNEHLLWECVEMKIIWSLFNNVISDNTREKLTLNSYEDIFRWEQMPILNVLKVKIIQQLIQIKRPKGWTKDTVTKLIKDFHKVEYYIAGKNEKLNDHNTRWNCFRLFLNSNN
jgi:hypothetical protein